MSEAVVCVCLVEMGLVKGVAKSVAQYLCRLGAAGRVMGGYGFSSTKMLAPHKVYHGTHSSPGTCLPATAAPPIAVAERCHHCG